MFLVIELYKLSEKEVRANIIIENFHNLLIILELILEQIAQLHCRTDTKYNEHKVNCTINLVIEIQESEGKERTLNAYSK